MKQNGHCQITWLVKYSIDIAAQRKYCCHLDKRTNTTTLFRSWTNHLSELSLNSTLCIACMFVSFIFVCQLVICHLFSGEVSLAELTLAPRVSPSLCSEHASLVRMPYSCFFEMTLVVAHFLKSLNCWALLFFVD